MADIKTVEDALLAFRNERNWKQYHNPKDMAISLCLEAAEVLEHFQWKSLEEMSEYTKSHASDIGEELADVLNWVILLAHDLGVNIVDASLAKIEKNAAKYPVEKTKNNHKKYTELT